jgi:hypothetical protein
MIIVEHIALVILLLSVVALVWLLLKKSCQIYEMDGQIYEMDGQLKRVSHAISKERKLNDMLSLSAGILACAVLAYFITRR